MRRVHNPQIILLYSKNSDSRAAEVNLTQSQKKKNIYSVNRLAAFEYVFFALTVIIPISVQAGFFKNGAWETRNQNLVEVVKTSSVIDAPLLVAAQNVDPATARGDADILAIDGVLVSTGSVGEDKMITARNRSGEISVYVVRPGDSLSQIAEMFDVTANTILWANDLPTASAIKPGDTLVILPIVGVRHVVKLGDTVASIAKKYEGNIAEIISFNQLVAEHELSVGATLVIPGGALHTAPVKAVTAARPTKSSASTNNSAVGNNALTHPVPGAIKTQGLHGYNGIDLGARMGTSILAAAAGEVIVSKSSGWNGGFGNYIVIKHARGIQTLYAHLSRNDVVVGEQVSQGEIIGGMGNSGKSTGVHLHFEVRGAKNPF
jgi:LysM repeat protein